MEQQAVRLVAAIQTNPWHLDVSKGEVVLEAVVVTHAVAREAAMAQIKPEWLTKLIATGPLARGAAH